MSHIHLTEPGTGLRWKENRLVAERGEQVVGSWPLNLIDSVFVHDKVFITGPACAALLDAGKPMVFLTRGGKLRGRLVPTVGNNEELRIAQYRLALDPARALEMSKALVAAKVANAAYLLDQSDDNFRDISLADHKTRLRDAEGSAAAAETTESLLGIEGAASAAYFDGLSQCFRGDLKFNGRARRPPPDPVNSLLSYGYSLTVSRLAALLEGISLDPFIGFYHMPDYGRPSLALDILEEFRTPVTDRLVLGLCNLRVFGPDDFEPGEEGGVYLKQEPRRKFLRRYEEHLSRAVTDPADGEKTTLRGMFLRQAERMARAIREGTAYRPYRL
jgi:CRISPR-associated protein Cas1